MHNKNILTDLSSTSLPAIIIFNKINDFNSKQSQISED